jgi:hypothetical protein
MSNITQLANAITTTIPAQFDHRLFLFISALCHLNRSSVQFCSYNQAFNTVFGWPGIFSPSFETSTYTRNPAQALPLSQTRAALSLTHSCRKGVIL